MFTNDNKQNDTCSLCSNDIKDSDNLCFKNYILTELEEAENSLNISQVRNIKFYKAENILKQDVDLNFIVCVKEGFVKQYYETDTGKNIIFNILPQGSIIGLTDLFTDSPLNFSLSAISEAKICLIPIKSLEKVVDNNPKFTKQVLKYINRKNEGFSKKVIGLTQRNMYQKVAELLLFFYQLNQNISEVDLMLTRGELAEMCLLSKETFIRVLKEFKDTNYISVKGTKVDLINIPALRSLSF